MATIERILYSSETTGGTNDDPPLVDLSRLIDQNKLFTNEYQNENGLFTINQIEQDIREMNFKRMMNEVISIQ